MNSDRESLPTPLQKVQRKSDSGLAKVVGFLPALVDLGLVMACKEAYQEKTNKIVDHDGRVLIDLSSKSIGKNFHIPTFDPMEETTKEYGKSMWKVNPLRCKKLINQYWLKEKRGNVNKVPQELFRSDFHEDYHDFITLLSIFMGIPTTTYF